MQKGRPAIRRLFLTIAVAVFVLCTGLRWMQARGTTVLIPSDLDFASASGLSGSERSLVAGDPGLIYPAITFPGGDDAVQFLCDLPQRPDGLMLIARSSKDSPRKSSSLDLLFHGSLIASVDAGSPNLPPGLHTEAERIRIPAAAISKSPTNTLVAHTGHGAFWQGSLTLVPHPSWLKPLNMALPLSAWLVLLIVAVTPAAGRQRRWFPMALAVCTFVVYRYTFFTNRCSPIGDLFFSDEMDILSPVVLNTFTFDMSKHVLFLPFVRALFRICRFLLRTDVSALCAVFAALGAANGVVAYVWLRRWTGNHRTASLLALLYAFTFSIWIYSAQFETYIASSFGANLFMLALLSREATTRGRWLRGITIYGAIAALLHPPLLILMVLVVLAHVRRDRTVRSVFEALATVASCIAIVILASFAIRHAYASTLLSHVPTASVASPLGEIGQARRIVGMYASPTNLTLHGASSVAFGQFLFSLIGLPYLPHWTDCGAGLRQLAHKGTGIAAFLGVACFWLAAIPGLLRTGYQLRRTLAVGLLVLGPWLAFFWYFNPGEMLLYSPPLLAPLLAWAWRGQSEWLERKWHDAALAVLALVIVIHNAAMLNTYP